METKTKITKSRIFLWFLMSIQMIAWAWFQYKAGITTDTQYLYFCIGMVVGQTGASIECINTKAWGTLVVQIYFFVFTIIGALQRMSVF